MNTSGKKNYAKCKQKKKKLFQLKKKITGHNNEVLN